MPSHKKPQGKPASKASAFLAGIQLLVVAVLVDFANSIKVKAIYSLLKRSLPVLASGSRR